MDGKYTDPDTGEIKWGVQLRTPYNYDRDDASIATALYCEDETLTQQQYKEEADINVMLERFGVTGVISQNIRQPIQADFVEAMTYHEAQNAMRQADEAFMELPSKIRERFKNDAGLFHDYFADEKNRAEAEEMGLVNPRPKPVDPPAPAKPAGGAPEGAGGATP